MTDRYQFAIEVAKNAGAILREGYYKQKTIQFKGDRDLVTEYDLKSEEFITKQIYERFTHDGILAEEGGEKSGTDGRWIIDPLDGTTNFAHGIPVFVSRHNRLARYTQKWAREHFDLFAADGFRSKTLTTVRNTRGIDVSQLNEHLRNHGMLIGNGYGKLKGQTFRIAHMGELRLEELRNLLEHIQEYI